MHSASKCPVLVPSSMILWRAEIYLSSVVHSFGFRSSMSGMKLCSFFARVCYYFGNCEFGLFTVNKLDFTKSLLKCICYASSSGVVVCGAVLHYTTMVQTSGKSVHHGFIICFDHALEDFLDGSVLLLRWAKSHHTWDGTEEPVTRLPLLESQMLGKAEFWVISLSTCRNESFTNQIY